MIRFWQRQKVNEIRQFMSVSRDKTILYLPQGRILLLWVKLQPGLNISFQVVQYCYISRPNM